MGDVSDYHDSFYGPEEFAEQSSEMTDDALEYIQQLERERKQQEANGQPPAESLLVRSAARTRHLEAQHGRVRP